VTRLAFSKKNFINEKKKERGGKVGKVQTAPVKEEISVNYIRNMLMVVSDVREVGS
jgi:hypothetical protein